jgi:hypothetical protein
MLGYGVLLLLLLAGSLLHNDSLFYRCLLVLLLAI